MRTVLAWVLIRPDGSVWIDSRWDSAQSVWAWTRTPEIGFELGVDPEFKMRGLGYDVRQVEVLDNGKRLLHLHSPDWSAEQIGAALRAQADPLAQNGEPT